ncbi:transporter substrate-binding domain-containing protein, partial [Salmonella enterica subsp. enterica serovar Anatum]|nr:transporter substrate-binding domain-containing protein [Salmonella enterica subsp. enterica serovar Anatum]
VRIGTDTTYAPFSSKDAKGEFIGFDIDLGNEMCKRMQVKCTWARSFESDAEAKLVHDLREDGFLTLGLVATDDEGQVVGYVAFSP